MPDAGLLCFICMQAVLLMTSVVMWVLSERRAAQADPLSRGSGSVWAGGEHGGRRYRLGRRLSRGRADGRRAENDGELPRYFTVVTAWFLRLLDHDMSSRTRELRRELERTLKTAIPFANVSVDDDRVMIEAGPATKRFLVWAIPAVVRVAAVAESRRAPTVLGAHEVGNSGATALGAKSAQG
jgi:hypothetical protein